jgi:hypothetical protein
LKCFTHFRFYKLQAQQNSFFWLNNVFVKVKVLFSCCFLQWQHFSPLSRLSRHWFWRDLIQRLKMCNEKKVFRIKRFQN